MARGLVWETVSWRCGADQYRFDIERGGLFATLTAPDRTLTLPMAVWDGLFDTLKARRATNSRSDQQFTARSRARWYDGEVAEVAESFRSGRSIGDIAQAYNRSAYAIEHQLDQLGLISKSGMYGPGRSRSSQLSSSPPGSSRSGPVPNPLIPGSSAESGAAPQPQGQSMAQPYEAPSSTLSGDRWEIRDDV